MRIKTFGTFVEVESLTSHVLQDCTVVVDAQNFFYQLYQNSGLQYIFGCESDKYAKYVRNYLNMFKKANVNCYFIFKGGHQNLKKRLDKKISEPRSKAFDINEENKEIVLPILMKDVYKQVLDEMNFNYTICEFEAKKECIALAQKLKCPVISYDIEFCFAGVPYIMQSTFQFDDKNNNIKCGMFTLENFLRKYNLTEEKLALFIALTDEKSFPENHFIDFIKTLRIPLSNYKRNLGIIRWLAKTNRTDARNQIFRHTNKEDKVKFLEVEKEALEMIRRQEAPGIPTQYLLNGNQIEITEKDQFWFEKGVSSKHIPIRFINVARSDIIEGTWAVADYTNQNAVLLSMEIIKYAYNLLTNFEKEKIEFFDYSSQLIPIAVNNSIQKPYEVSCRPFENGWQYLNGELFEHFLTESLPGLNFNKLNKLPKDARMLMITLIYFSKKKAVDVKSEVCAVLLSYVALSVIADADKNNNDNFKTNSSKQTMRSIDKEHIAEADKLRAKDMLAGYLADVTKQEARLIFDVTLLHPLVEFQHCLEYLNFLNTLCGKLYMPTIYSKTYNGSLVYKVLYDIKRECDGDCMKFLKDKLILAFSVYSFLQNLLKVYDDILFSI